MRFGFIFLMLVGGCVDPKVRDCPTVICPFEMVCDDRGGCAFPEQLSTCAGAADGTPCSYPGTANGECKTALCVPFGCGNGLVNANESCDDGNTVNGDGCSADCRSLEVCGNGIPDLAAGEQCDGVGGDARCRPDCTQKLCGDGILDSPQEACDDGPNNSDQADAPCRTNCQQPRCSDGVIDVLAGEICDDGNTAADDGCSADCRSLEICGNTIVDVVNDEACDDGNDDDDDDCHNNCTLPNCGDGTLRAPEQCDESDLGTATCASVGLYGAGALACTSLCTFDVTGCDRCGDGAKNGPELCDGTQLGGKKCTDLNFQSGTLKCSQACSFDTSSCVGSCGNGVREGNEQCDGSQFLFACAAAGFHTGNPSCLQGCVLSFSTCSGRCGDGVIDSGFEDCDSSTVSSVCEDFNMTSGSLGCNGSCRHDFSSCEGCGNGSCDGGEDCNSCPDDCGECGSCGDAACTGSEDCGNCSQDCGECPFCGDTSCDTGISEDCSSCPQDCGDC